MPRTARRKVKTDSDQMLKELKMTKLLCSKLEFSNKKKKNEIKKANDASVDRRDGVRNI